MNATNHRSADTDRHGTNELTSSPEPAPASPAMSKSMLKRMAHAPAPSPASGLLPVAREGLTLARLSKIAAEVGMFTHLYEDHPCDYCERFVRAIEAAHGIAPASGDAPGEAK